MKTTVAILAAVVLVLMTASIATATDTSKGLTPGQYATCGGESSHRACLGQSWV